ncbi:hypothetical protein E4U32_000526 [Claviceps aff. humidiphila group G2b]|nr:hypothetical protein E4U32_000526 [Claviceps aff. humidiphila group G2b]
MQLQRDNRHGTTQRPPIGGLRHPESTTKLDAGCRKKGTDHGTRTYCMQQLRAVRPSNEHSLGMNYADPQIKSQQTDDDHISEELGAL